MKRRQAVELFADAMERELQANEHKGGWQGCDKDYLIMRLREETRELIVVLRDPEGTLDTITAEAADVANFAMMIADNFGDLQAVKEALG